MTRDGASAFKCAFLPRCAWTAHPGLRAGQKTVQYAPCVEHDLF